MGILIRLPRVTRASQPWAERHYPFGVNSRRVPRVDCIPAAQRADAAAEFDDLLRDIFGPRASHRTHGVTDPHRRQLLRAGMDALVARLYDLTEAEFTHILAAFPLVDPATKQLTLTTYRTIEGQA